ncbi:hypothetical protein SAMN04487965_2001 [Microbulbifer donghaiensis]|uniref:Uncharacterized protein n=1 Tax=Microbulbifer donghaiensis TaxID=494016 RepID=A0A1M5AYH6_9GAMM|nr:hypothetical protein [Microbulbifer donghaiensis]SHF34962.1 hypothetical protein SAMN04487965_2001 [Microbulbifer donghaiensis]
MSCTSFCHLLLSSAVLVGPSLASADTIERNNSEATLPGEMEYIEVIGEPETDDEAREKAQQAREFRQRQQKRSRLEQVQSLKLRQQQLLDRFRTEKEKALAAERDRRGNSTQEAARAEELRLEQERNRAEELRRLEEERLRTEAKAQQQEPS